MKLQFSKLFFYILSLSRVNQAGQQLSLQVSFKGYTNLIDLLLFVNVAPGTIHNWFLNLGNTLSNAHQI